MNLRQMIDRLFSQAAPATASNRARRRSSLRVETLESRENPAGTLAAIGDFTSPSGRDLLVPLALTSPSATPVTYTATSSNSAVTTELITGGRTLVLNVSGVDANNVAFNGNITIRLFESAAPLATERIISLAQSGFYNGLTFHRVIQNFVAQGGDPNGDGTGGSTRPTFKDEFNTGLTFNSPGLFALANSGDDTNNSQFFITDIDLSLAQQPRNLNFQHTILGQLVDGQDLFAKLIATPTNASDKPITPATINTATVITDTTHGVLRVKTNRGFTGSSTITVTGNDGTGASAPETFGVNVVTDTDNSRAFLGATSNQTTTAGTGVTFRLTGTDAEGDALTYVVRDATTFANQPLNATVTIDQATGLVTVSPNAGFTGTIRMRVGVRDATARPTGSNLNTVEQFDTDIITLTVTGAIDLNAASDTGALPDDNVTDASSPTFTIRTTPGSTVRLSVQGQTGSVVTATESSAGVFTATLPAGFLAIGSNSIIAESATSPTGTFAQIGSLPITYAPRLRNLYTVPGALGVDQQLTFDYSYSETGFLNEVGVIRVDDVNGSIGGVSPGDANYIQTALSSSGRRVLFSPSETAGATNTVTYQGGDLLMLYIISNDNSTTVLSQALVGGNITANIFFSLVAANRDGTNHVSATDDPLSSQAVYTFEDLVNGGDLDYNDFVLTVRPSTATVSEAIQVAANAARAVSATFTLEAAIKAGSTSDTATTTAGGEIGLFVVDDATGKIGSLSPGDIGYIQAALARRQSLFGIASTPTTATSTLLTGGSFLGFYFIPGSTAADVLAQNPTNDPANASQLAYVSFAAGNPDKIAHIRGFSPEKVNGGEATSDEPFSLHLMGKLNGTNADFDDAVFTMKVGS